MRRTLSRRILRGTFWTIGGLVVLVAIAIAVLVVSSSAREWLATRILTQGMILDDRLANVPTRNEAQPVRNFMLPMRDGVKLSTEVFLPQGEGPWPAVVVRDPYSFADYLSCRVFVLYDYACVYQEVRGRGPSEGTWYPFVDEREDGIDLLEWVVEQPWQNGRIALHGGSYVGAVQWAVAGDLPPEVKTFVPTVSHGDIYELSYHNGMFMEGLPGAWLHSQFQPWTRKLNSFNHWREKVAGRFPAQGVDPEEFGRAWTPYYDYLLHPDRDDPYWQSAEYVALREAHKNVDVPVLMIGYMNDFFLPGMLRTFNELPTRDESVLIIGPGNHGGQAEPEVDGAFTNDYVDTLAWFDHFLRDAPLPENLKPGVRVFIHGDDKWRDFGAWPELPSKTLIFYLEDLADARQCDGGALSDTPSATVTSTSFIYDPRDPVPTRGGAFALIDGVAPTALEEQGSDLCGRDDVLSFASAPLQADTLINGGIQVKLVVSSDAADTAFTVKVSEHFADGRVYNIRDDISSLSMRNGAQHRMPYVPGDKVEVVFELTPIAWRLSQGSKLRLDVSSSSAPAFFPHPNRAGLWSEIADPVVALQTVFGGSMEIPVDERP